MDKYSNMWKNLSSFSLKFENPLELMLKCKICKKVLVNARQSECGCRFCEKCLNNYINSGNEICPGDECQNLKITENQCITDHVANRQISELVVECPFNQCCYTCLIKDLDNHINICEFNGRVVVNLDEINDSGEVEEHTVLCDFCGLICDVTEMKSRHNNIDSDEFCELFTGKCPYECNLDDLFPLKHHIRICINKPLPCPYFVQGCDIASISKSRMNDHLCQNGLEHTNLLLEMITNLENGIRNSENQLIFKDRDINKFKEKLNLFEVENRNIKNENDQLKVEMDNLKIELNAINRLVGELVNQRQTESNCQLNSLKDSIERNETEISVIQRILKQNDLKYESRYTEYIWKIDNLSQLTEDAKMRNDKQIVFSKHFFSSRNGYRMRMAMIPFSHNSGFISLKFQFLQSRFDDILEWPFRCDISISILNQINSNQHVELHSFYDPSNVDQMRIYQRPQDESGDFFGFPEFIKRRALREQEGLVVNDTMFVRFCVRPINLG